MKNRGSTFWESGRKRAAAAVKRSGRKEAAATVKEGHWYKKR
jgi:hypothetical protein